MKSDEAKRKKLYVERDIRIFAECMRDIPLKKCKI